MQYLLEFTKVLIWPVLIVFLVLFLRQELQGLLSRLSQLKWGDKEASFEQKVKYLHRFKEKVEIGERFEFKIDRHSEENTLDRLKDELLEKIKSSPYNAVMNASFRLESAIYQIADSDYGRQTSLTGRFKW